MALASTIEWTETTWNPVTGCDKISPGCKHCYAERMAKRLAAMAQPNYRNGFELTLQPHMLERPLHWRKPDLDLTGIDWVIVGGESGPGARPMHAEWVTAIRDQCLAAGVPFYFKQWGGVNKKRAGRLLEGRTWDEMPRDLSRPRDGSGGAG